jgi:hypothetical protein
MIHDQLSFGSQHKGAAPGSKHPFAQMNLRKSARNAQFGKCRAKGDPRLTARQPVVGGGLPDGHPPAQGHETTTNRPQNGHHGQPSLSFAGANLIAAVVFKRIFRLPTRMIPRRGSHQNQIDDM